MMPPVLPGENAMLPLQPLVLPLDRVLAGILLPARGSKWWKRMSWGSRDHLQIKNPAKAGPRLNADFRYGYMAGFMYVSDSVPAP
jgi:hypothetical protein